METTPEDKKKADQKEYQKQWAIKNKEAIRIRKKTYRIENAEKIKNRKKKYYEENPEALTLKGRKYYEKHLKSIRIYAKKYTEENKERIKLQKKGYYKENSENIKKVRKIYLTENKEKIRIQRKKYREKNNEKIRIQQRKYVTERLENDPIYKMIHILRVRIRCALKYQSVKKSSKTLDLLGASKEEVWKHLESHFKEGMTRENHGLRGWHIDHIKPMSSFDLSDHEQLKECCHYTNLQPLWWWENLSKGNKILDKP